MKFIYAWKDHFHPSLKNEHTSKLLLLVHNLLSYHHHHHHHHSHLLIYIYYLLFDLEIKYNKMMKIKLVILINALWRKLFCKNLYRFT